MAVMTARRLTGLTPWMTLASLVLGSLLSLLTLNLMAASPLGDSTATTESSCNFGMAKGESKQSCRVPIPAGCAVAHFPGTNKPWTNISKGGATTCKFNEKETDWRTRITGTCSRCTTEQCSARFAVVFDCSAALPPPITQTPQKP